MTLDLNCDMGELPDAEYEAALMEHVTSANVACGEHAGDDRTMERTVRLALRRGVRIGAHPGYPDRVNFGRIVLPMTPEEVAETVRRQVARLHAIVERQGGRILYVKPHGALYNRAAHDRETALAIGAAVSRWDRSLTLFGLAGSPALEVWSGMGLAVAGEGFADRRYEADGTLRSRQLEGALITEPAEAAGQAARLAREGNVQTICVHGDTPGAVEILKTVREALEKQ